MLYQLHWFLLPRLYLFGALVIVLRLYCASVWSMLLNCQCSLFMYYLHILRNGIYLMFGGCVILVSWLCNGDFHLFCLDLFWL